MQKNRYSRKILTQTALNKNTQVMKAKKKIEEINLVYLIDFVINQQLNPTKKSANENYGKFIISKLPSIIFTKVFLIVCL